MSTAYTWTEPPLSSSPSQRMRMRWLSFSHSLNSVPTGSRVSSTSGGDTTNSTSTIPSAKGLATTRALIQKTRPLKAVNLRRFLLGAMSCTGSWSGCEGGDARRKVDPSFMRARGIPPWASVMQLLQLWEMAPICAAAAGSGSSAGAVLLCCLRDITGRTTTALLGASQPRGSASLPLGCTHPRTSTPPGPPSDTAASLSACKRVRIHMRRRRL
mmetsp:Transcript_24505/g.68163  ORF Transcript_24505/g.68163 Transcript_24505/m.68163 type:complete len:214 (-) Transcript_24505:6632-7273(-)